MSILNKKNINIEKKLNKTVSFSTEIKKDKRIKLTYMTYKPGLILKFNDLAQKRKWNKTILMNEILTEYFNKCNRKEFNNNGDMGIISFCNKRGDVSKTTLCKNIVYNLAQCKKVGCINYFEVLMNITENLIK